MTTSTTTAAASGGPRDDAIERKARKLKRLNDMQLGPAKSLPMMLFMLWMAGNEIHIFSIMITGTAISQPLQALFGVNDAFKLFAEDDDIKADVWRAKAVYLLMCLVALGVGFVKLSWMGLLPAMVTDWIDHTPPVYETVATRSY